MVTAKGIAENVAKEKDGCYVHNSPQRFLSYVISSLMLYTDLELTGENNIEVYDTLQEYGLVDVIMELIGTDGVEYQTIFNMVFEDLYANTTTTQAFLSKQVTRLGQLCDGGMTKLAETIEKIDTDSIMSNFEKLKKHATKLTK